MYFDYRRIKKLKTVGEFNLLYNSVGWVAYEDGENIQIYWIDL